MDGRLYIFGSEWQNPNGNVNVPILNENDDKRNLNLNWNDSDNQWNDNYRFVAVSQCLHCARLIQPPSILPISTSCSDSMRNFLSEIALISQAICRKNLRRSSLPDALQRQVSFVLESELAAIRMNSMVSRNSESILEPSV